MMNDETHARARKIAKYLVQRARGKQSKHFFVVEGYGQPPVPFPYHWRFKNACGVTFPRDHIDAAEEWVTQALLAGYAVFPHNARWGSSSTGRALEQGLPERL
jgi:hypothetical protein